MLLKVLPLFHAVDSDRHTSLVPVKVNMHGSRDERDLADVTTGSPMVDNSAEVHTRKLQVQMPSCDMSTPATTCLA